MSNGWDVDVKPLSREEVERLMAGILAGVLVEDHQDETDSCCQ